MEGVSLCIIPFKGDKLKKVVGWDGFIAPNGDFLKVCERDKLVAAHDYFAEEYMDIVHKKDIKKEYEEFQKTNPKFKNIRLGSKDILINLYGYVNFEYTNGTVEITPPNKDFKNLKLTDDQLLTALELIKLNGDSIDSLKSLFFEHEKRIFRKTLWS